MLFVAGCVTEQRHPVDETGSAVLPSKGEVLSVFSDAYLDMHNRSPKGERVNSIRTGVVIGNKTDVLACVSTEEVTTDPVFNDSGMLVKPVGTTFRQNWITLIRQYDGRWEVGILRRAEAIKIGHAAISDYCP